MSVQYFNVTLTQCDYQNVSPVGMVRLIASEKVFFFNLDDFKNSETFLARLKSGDKLVICAQKMNDGSYWLDWVFHQEHGRLEPERDIAFDRTLTKQYIISIVLMLFTIAAYYCFIFEEDSVFLIVLAAIFSCVAFSGLVVFLLALAQTKRILSPQRKSILLALDKVIEGHYRINTQTGDIEIEGIKNVISKPKTRHISLNENTKKNNLSVTRGKVRLDYLRSLAVTSYNTERQINEINFQVNKSHLRVLVSANEPLFNNHNLFIAQGDDIEVFHESIHENSKDEVVFGIYNHQDNLAYTLSQSGAPQERGFYIGVWGFTAFMFGFFILMAGSLSIIETVEKGGYWDRWDWLNIVDSGFLFISFATTILLGISFLVGLCVACYFKFSKRGHGYYQAQYLLTCLREKNGLSKYVTEIRS